MLSVDLMWLDSWERFERLCCQLARQDFPGAVNVRASWDGGRDVMVWSSLGTGDVVWQCKFTKDLGSNTKNAVRESIKSAIEHYRDFQQALAERRVEDPAYDQLLTARAHQRGEEDRAPHIARWILCIPVKVTAQLLDWLRVELAPYPFEWEVWDQTALLERLEKRPDLIDRYFYRVYAELQRHFQSEELEVLRFEHDTSTEQQWTQPDPAVLEFVSSGGVHDPDLILDIILRNRGQLETIVTGISATVEWKTWKPHGIPGSGLLVPQITYVVPIGHGQEGSYIAKCEPPLQIRGHGVERFKIKVSDTGYAWRGSVRLSIVYGAGKRMSLPYFGLYI